MKIGLARVITLGLTTLCVSTQAQAQQTLAPYEEHEKFTRAAQTVAPLTSELFGDQISLYSGTTEFVVTDIDLPGNNALPVQLRRRFKVEPRKDLANLGGFGVWDLDIPYIYGTFANGSKWNEGQGGISSRCLSGNWGPILPGPPFGYGDVFKGIRIHLPGKADTDLLKQHTGNPHQPTDGAAYPYVSQDFISISCVATTKNGYPGEGFVAVTTDGLRYTFDIGVERHGGTVRKDLVTYSGTFRRTADRTQVFLLVGRIEDRHGNWVSYDYTGSQLTTIRSSDGRRIDLSYNGNTIVQAAANERSWRYQYTPITFGIRLNNHLLDQVIQPDGSAWTYQYEDTDGCTGVGSEGCPGLLGPEYHMDADTAMDPRCLEPFGGVDEFALTSGHPSGARGEFRFIFQRQHRTNTPANTCVPRQVPGSSGFNYELQTPDYFDGYGISSKTITGPGVAPQIWRYGMTGPRCRWGSTCPDQKTSVVIQPDGSRMEYVFGVMYGVNDGKLLETRTVSSNGTMARSEALTYVTDTEAATMPFPDYYGPSFYGPDDPLALRIRPLRQTAITQDGETFTRTVDAFDALARPTQVAQASSLDYGRYSRTEEIVYHDNPERWLLGQIKQVTQTNPTPSVVISQTDYDAADLPWRQYQFGWLRHTLTYNADGTLATVADGKNNTTALADWKRGIPQTIRDANGATQTAAVDDNGWVRSITDKNGFNTQYDYDAMGRITLVDYPDGDTVDWASTASSFAPVAASEYGLPAGHWKQTVSTGNARKVTYFDALWRPVVEEAYDAADVDGTLSQTVRRYDPLGRLIFQSYPLRGVSDFNSGSQGMRTYYDVLDRPTQVEQDSELGPLVTRTEYLAGFQIRTTSPKGAQTTTSFMAYDQPTTEWPVSIAHPEGVHTDIVRDPFGKPRLLRRRNADGTVALTRQYVYGDLQRLCKTIEPETGATVLGYDEAGNLDWSATGLSLTDPNQCNQSDAYASGRRVQRSYDAMNRLTGLAFPNGNGDQNLAYWPDGLVKQIITNNIVDGASVTAANTYDYNKRRLLTGESLAQDGGPTWSLVYGYDTLGHLSNHTYPSGRSVASAPDALGQPTQAGTFATGVRYYPNGAMAQFTYGNGQVHTLTQNARGLPERSRDSSSIATALDDNYDYDAHGNVAAISDARLGNRGHRDMVYDGLDRLTATTSPMFGAAEYAYDVLDNLQRVKTVSRDHTYIYDASNRLTNVMVGSSTVVGLGYDAQGNLNNKSGQAFAFDYGNRLRTAGKESYRYDGHGRRIQADYPIRGTISTMYDQDGVLRTQHNTRTAKATDYIQLNGSLVAEVAYEIAPAAPVVTAPGYSTDGSFTVQWSAVTGATGYNVEESVDGEPWVAVYSGSAQSQIVEGRNNGAFSYRAQACNAAGCGQWSALATVFVQRPPYPPAGITVPVSGPSGNYTIGWLPPNPRDVGPITYTLQERFNEQAWVIAYQGADLSVAFSGKAAGSYAYQVWACNPYGCSTETVGSNPVQVTYPPATPATLSVPENNLTGDYPVSWSASDGATTYHLDESFNDGAWTRVHDVAITSVTLNGRQTGIYGYRVSACNGVGCSDVSATALIQVTVPPPTAPQIHLPASSDNGSYGVSWSGVPHTTYYQLVERVDGGGFNLIHDNGATEAGVSGRGTGRWEYMVRACNQAGCGPYSGMVGLQVLLPPATPTITHSLKSQTSHSPIKIACSVRWTPIAHADRYELWSHANGQFYQHQYNGPEASVGTTLNQNSAAYCAPSHVARACNASGCSSWSAQVTQLVNIIPTDPGGGIPIRGANND